MAAVEGVEGEEPPPAEPAPPVTEKEYAERMVHLQALFEDMSAEDLKKASKLERKTNGQEEEIRFTYGEMDAKLLHELLELVKQDVTPLFVNKGCFLDLGSGAGKACIAAALLHSFEKVIGIEIVEALHGFATTAQSRWEERDLGPEMPNKPSVSFQRGDMNELVGSVAPEVTLALAVSTTYSAKEMYAIQDAAKLMPDNSIFITFTQMLPPSIVNHTNPTEVMAPEKGGWKLVHERIAEMVWGKTTCFVFKKEPPPEAQPAEPPVEGA